MNEEKTEYVVITDWDKHVHPDLVRAGRAKPPFRWIKMFTDNLDVMGDLTPREFGAYCRLVLLAAQTNNRTVFNANWIKRRTGITRNLIEKLQKRSLIAVISDCTNSENTQQNQTIDSENTSNPPADPQQITGIEGRGRGRDKNRGESIQQTGIRPNGRQPNFKDMMSICMHAGLVGNDVQSISNEIFSHYGFWPSEKQIEALQLQLQDRSKRH